MFRIGVFSDTHGILHKLEEALELAGSLDLIVHAGDLYSDAAEIAAVAGVPYRAVAGNCDLPGIGPLEEVVLRAGRRILLVHGHMYGVKCSYGGLLNKARQEQASIVIFGHTHRAECRCYDNILLFNPGSLSRPPYNELPCFGVLEMNEKMVRPHIYRLKKSKKF